jgi:CheY-like chemotaxis protein
MKSVIIAEDNKSVRESYKLWIEGGGITIDEVENGSALVEKVKENDYSLILTDNNMPGGINGLKAIAEIRKFNKNIPIYLLCSVDEGEAAYLRKNLEKYGINEFIDKGDDNFSSKLVKIINKHLK